MPVVFNNGSNYNYHFIIKELTNQFEGKLERLGENTNSNYNYHFVIKELANDFEGKLECLGEKTEKYKSFQFQWKTKSQKSIKILMKLL